MRFRKLPLSFVLRSLVFVYLGFQNLVLLAQFQDNFSDGNFSANPTWLGNTADFTISPTFELQLNAAAAGTSSLYVPVLTQDSAVWEFYFNLDFEPSTSNQLKVFLNANQSDFQAPLNGYLLQIGETGSNDALELYRQNGTTRTLLIRATNAAVATAPAKARVRIVRNSTGNWQLWADYSGGTNFQLEGTAADNTFPNGQFFGVSCIYTSTRKDKFFFDDFWINPLFVDTAPPQLLSVTALSPTQLDLRFDENLQLAPAITPANYSINNGIGSPSLANLDVADPTLVHLTLPSSLIEGQSYQLSVTNLRDPLGNTITTPQTVSFSYQTPFFAHAFDILITEIMADPTPAVGLPEAEYLEIFNRTTQPIDLRDFTLSKGSTPAFFPAVTLQGGEYAVVCDLSDTTLFSSYGRVIGLDDFPTLNNSGDNLQLFNENGEWIDMVSYSPTWYQASGKDEGGWSLERINPNQPCLTGSDNWRASESLLGGTPAQPNSILQTDPDQTPPTLVRAFPESNTVVRLLFSERMDENTATELSHFNFSGGLAAVDAVLEQPDLRSVLLTLNAPLQTGVLYEVTVSSQVTDCIGNAINPANQARFAVPEAIAPYDLVINEVLFNPQTGGVDFVEIFNRSNKILTLKDLRIASANEGLVDVVEPVEVEALIFPQAYAVLSEDPTDLLNRYFSSNSEQIFENELPSYPDDEGGVALVANGQIIDQFNYSEDFHFELLDERDGVSLERLDPDAPTQNPNNWHSAAATVGYATPAYANSQGLTLQTPADGFFFLEKNTFSPNNDGFEDFLILNYEADATGYVATIQIFDARGRFVATLLDNELLATKGFFKWDGVTAEGTVARLGVHVLQINLFNPDGNQQRFKRVFVVAGQL